MEEIALAGAALALIEKLIPQIAAMVKKGQVPPEEQQALLDKYNAVKTAVESGFEGPEWQQAPTP